jgi:hypothetical protein
MAPPALAVAVLTQTVDSWTAQAVMASGYLVGLYRILGDDRQATLAMQACGPCEERAQRLGLQARIKVLDAAFAADYPEELLGEEKAWQLVVEAHAGLCALHGLIDDLEQDFARTGSATALRHALRGYRTAFPEECTIPGIHQAMASAAARCADTFVSDGDDPEDRETLEYRRRLQITLLDALLKEAL